MNHTEFLKKVELLVKPIYTECFTDETRKMRNLLFATSFVLILLAFKIVEFEGTFTLLGASFKVHYGLRWIIFCICLFFFITVILRTYSDWKLWRLTQQAAMAEFLDLIDTITSKWMALTADANETQNKGKAIVNEITELNKEWTNTKQKIQELNQQFKNLDTKHKSQVDALEYKQSEKDIAYMADAIRDGGWTFKFRFWWEMFIPIIFGFIAIIAGLI